MKWLRCLLILLNSPQLPEKTNNPSRGQSADAERMRSVIFCWWLKDSLHFNMDGDQNDSLWERALGIRDFFRRTNRKILVSKAFYTFFYVAIGSLFPYLPVYFKQLRLSPHQTGVLIGVRPLIQFWVTPLWGACADKLCKSKAILLLSVLGWLVSNFSLSLVPDSSAATTCSLYPQDLGDEVAFLRRTNISLKPNNRRLSSKEVGTYSRKGNIEDDSNHPSYRKPVIARSEIPPSFLSSGFSLENLIKVCDNQQNSTGHTSSHKNAKKSRDNKLNEWPVGDVFEDIMHDGTMEITPEQGGGATETEQYLPCDSKVFIFLFVVTIVGTIISAPTQMLADTATLQSLEGETQNYGRVRLWGSLGWGIGGFSVGTAVSTNYKTDSCGMTVIDYLPCFIAYAVAMALSFLCATQFQFPHTLGNFSVKGHGLVDGLKVFKRPQYCFVMFLAFFCGSATGFIETFLFWYLHELGGGQFLFSVINGLNCFAEVCVFFVTDRLLSSLGHINVMYLALFCYSIRFLYFYFVTNPWAVLPAELLQGITTAAFWASCVSYVGLHPGASHTLQGILNGVYMGLGFATGGFAGGALVHYVGMPDAFLLYALASLLILVGFAAIEKVAKK